MLYSRTHHAQPGPGKLLKHLAGLCLRAAEARRRRLQTRCGGNLPFGFYYKAAPKIFLAPKKRTTIFRTDHVGLIFLIMGLRYVNSLEVWGAHD